MKMIAIPSQNYEIGETTVTQKEWREVMGTEPWKGQKYVREGDDYPAVYVSWDDAVEFCEKLSEKEGKDYRLPTEDEWEYACRGGTKTAFSFGDDEAKLSDYAWWGGILGAGNAKDEWYAHRVAQKLPNQFGLYDMHGNVWEWCSDSYNENQGYRVLRGGSWRSVSGSCSAWYRYFLTPEDRDYNSGFRLARTLTEQLSEKVVSCDH